MAPSTPRRHRLPQNYPRDYVLIPAPLDLSVETVGEKSLLPAIVVTPSSPSSSADFSIAFLAPQPKPSLLKRISASLSSPTSPTFSRLSSDSDSDSETISSTISTPSLRVPSHPKLQFKARTSFLLLLLFFIIACHLLTHRLATRIPHLEFGNVHDLTLNPGSETTASTGTSSWWNWNYVWGENTDFDVNPKEFVIREGEGDDEGLDFEFHDGSPEARDWHWD